MTRSTTTPRPARRAARGPLRPALAGLAVLGLLTACSSAGAPASTPSPTAAQADALTITDPWVKAADEGMTAAFGVLENSSDQDVRIVSATTALATVELHEMTTDSAGAMVMQQKEGGFVVEAGGTHALAPGGDHLMLMDLTAPVEPGDEVTITLTAEDGSTFELTAPARSFSGAEEEYVGEDDMDMGGSTATEDAHGDHEGHDE